MKLPSPEIIAIAFCRHLLHAIGPEKISIVNRRNAGPENAGSCATHDFCDANVVMEDAFIAVTRKDTDALSTATDPYYKGEGCMSDAVAAIWNNAWSLASAAGFNPDNIGKTSLYTVQYAIEVEATSRVEAAREALRHIQQNGSEAVFFVKLFTGKDRTKPKGFHLVDLSVS